MDSTSPKWPGVEAGVQVRPRLRRAMFPPRAKRPTRHETNETRGVISGTPRRRTATRGVYARACPRIPIAVSTIGTEPSPLPRGARSEPSREPPLTVGGCAKLTSSRTENRNRNRNTRAGYPARRGRFV